MGRWRLPDQGVRRDETIEDPLSTARALQGFGPDAEYIQIDGSGRNSSIFTSPSSGDWQLRNRARIST